MPQNRVSMQKYERYFVLPGNAGNPVTVCFSFRELLLECGILYK